MCGCPVPGRWPCTPSHQGCKGKGPYLLQGSHERWHEAWCSPACKCNALRRSICMRPSAGSRKMYAGPHRNVSQRVCLEERVMQVCCLLCELPGNSFSIKSTKHDTHTIPCPYLIARFPHLLHLRLFDGWPALALYAPATFTVVLHLHSKCSQEPALSLHLHVECKHPACTVTPSAAISLHLQCKLLHCV